MTPADAERLTRLRGKYLAALENDDFDALPGRVYARAFLRTYADALGLEADRFVDEFDDRYPEPEEGPQVTVIRPPRRPRLSPRVLLILGAVAAAAGVVAWSSLSPQPKLASVPKPTPAAKHVAPARPRTSAPSPKPVVIRHAPLVIRATNGRCWLLVRRGGPAGPVLYEGILEQGRTMQFRPRVWMRLGAPWNVVAHRGARAVRGLAAKNPVNIVA